MGDAPEIVSDSMNNGSNDTLVVLWNTRNAYVEAEDNMVELMSIVFKVADKALFETEFASDNPAIYPFVPAKDYEKYYENGCYKAALAPNLAENEFAIEYVDVYFADHSDEYAETEFADVEFIVDAEEKLGATVSNIAYVAYSVAGVDEWTFIALEESGNTEDAQKIISEVFINGCRYDLKILKNGYVGCELEDIEVSDDMVITVTLIGGDIKGSAVGDDEDAVDFGDFGDGVVNLSDFVRVLRAFDTTSSADFKSSVDINEDGTVTVGDIAIIKANYTK